MWDLRNKINEQTKQKHRLIDNSEQTEGCQMRKSRRIGEKGEGSKELQNNHADVKNNIVNIVSSTVMTMYDARWVLEISGGLLCRLYNRQTVILYS